MKIIKEEKKINEEMLVEEEQSTGPENLENATPKDITAIINAATIATVAPLCLSIFSTSYYK